MSENPTTRAARIEAIEDMRRSNAATSRRGAGIMARGLAAYVRQFTADADQFLSIKFRDDLIEIMKDLEEFSRD